jgi:hypothetical protein
MHNQHSIKNAPQPNIRIAKEYHSLPELRLNIQPPLLWQDQHIPIVITKSLPLHRCVGEIHMDSESFTQRRITIASNRFQPIDEVHFGGIRWKLEGMPSELGGADMHLWVEWEKTGFKLKKTHCTVRNSDKLAKNETDVRIVGKTREPLVGN